MGEVIVRLIGGPAELAVHQQIVEGLPERIAIPFRAGYEHFQRLDESPSSGEEMLVADYVWEYRTAIAE